MESDGSRSFTLISCISLPKNPHEVIVIPILLMGKLQPIEGRNPDIWSPEHVLLSPGLSWENVSSGLIRVKARKGRAGGVFRGCWSLGPPGLEGIRG